MFLIKKKRVPEMNRFVFGSVFVDCKITNTLVYVDKWIKRQASSFLLAGHGRTASEH